MARRKRITRREIKEDKAILFMYQVVDYVSKHTQEVIIAVAVVLLAGMAGFWYSNMKQADSIEAARLLAPGNTAFQQERFEDAITIYDRIQKDFDGTAAAAEAVLRLANAQYRLGKTDEAHSAYKQYLDDYAEDETSILSARAGLAACLEQQEKYEEAAKGYKTLADEYPNSFLTPQFLMNAGRCFHAAQDVDQAKTMYNKVINDYENTRYVRDAKIALAMI